MDFLANLFSFDGRIGRGGYWLVGLVQLMGALVLIAVLLAGSGGAKVHGAGAPSLGVLAIGSLLLAWIGLAASVKRCHDRDHSGFWLLVNFIPIVGPIWTFVELALLPGSYGANRFGPAPGEGSAGNWTEPSGSNEPDLDGIVARWRTSETPRATATASYAAPVAARSSVYARSGDRSGPVTGFGRRGLR